MNSHDLGHTPSSAPNSPGLSVHPSQPDEKIPFFPYRFMAVDAGSNAIKYRLWEVEEDGSVRQLAEKRYPIRLGLGAFRTGQLREKDILATVEAFKGIAKDGKSFNVNMVRAVATSAMRESSNSLSLVRRVARETSINLEILPAAEEARLIALGVLGSRPQLNEQYLLIDIGGGSTEVILASDPDIISADSMRLGAVRLKELFFPKAPPSPEQLELAEAHIHDVLMKTLCLPELSQDLQCLGSAGTIVALQAMAATLPGHNPTEESISLDEVDRLVSRLKTLGKDEIGQEFQIDAQRAEVILPGALVLRAIMRRLEIKRVGPVRGGVSDGLLHAFLERTGLRRSRLFDHDRAFLIQALALGEHYHSNRHHAQQVSRLAASIFDQLQVATNFNLGLGPVDRRLLKGAALLHEIGQYIAYSGHHKHSYYLILHSDLPGLSGTEKLILACVARYHRKSHPKAAHEGFHLLDKPGRERVRRLAAILRIADALDREQQSLVNEVRVKLQPHTVDFYISVHYQAAIEIWSAKQKGDLFEEAFGLKPQFFIVNI